MYNGTGGRYAFYSSSASFFNNPVLKIIRDWLDVFFVHEKHKRHEKVFPCFSASMEHQKNGNILRLTLGITICINYHPFFFVPFVFFVDRL
ncbi:hypothetical protein CRENPOLYSF2_770010 [Crenothrix polyspora]|uniref:Uncharacterized protein n=1 Tax=Crenothrix polyspora TaxID=360316 RepID=A0A1R4HI44_9GAMM|nr:hypothetical protein CRENPOLYSF2_770010 [Crenothrix polyspora]